MSFPVVLIPLDCGPEELLVAPPSCGAREVTQSLFPL